MPTTKKFQNILVNLGDFTLFFGEAMRCTPRLWKRRSLFFKQCEFIGISSTGILLTAAVFLGAVMGYQLYEAFHRFGAEALLGGSVGVALFRELGPVMAAIMVTGRAGAAIAAEIATMQITEQIDALEVMAVNPIEFLVTPRIWAGLFMMPLLGAIFSIVGVLAAAGVGCGIMGLSFATFWEQFILRVDPLEVIHCTSKSAVFGVVITWVSCFFGFRASGGAMAVGLATRTTVVVSLLMILLTDYIMTSILPFGYTYLKLI